MPTKITMPQLGESVAEGTVGRWLKSEGEMVKKDESLVEIITDKVTAELPSPVSGRLVKILVKEDETVKVGVDIAEIDESGSTSAASATSSTGTSSTAGGDTTAGVAKSASANSNGNGTSTAANTATLSATAPTNGAARASAVTRERGEKISPLARRLAQEYQLDLNEIQGSGEGGRVRKEDITAYIAQRSQQPAPVATPTAPAAPQVAPPVTFTPATPTAPAAAPAPFALLPDDEVITPTPARRAIAEHMVRSKHTSPHATTLVEVDMTNLAHWLDQRKDEFKRREGYGISFQTFAIKAAIEGLKEYPDMNASWTDDGKLVKHKQIHIGVSIALNNNLMVPVIRNADTLNITGIARATSDLVTRARSNRLMPTDLQGSTFTVNNPGVFGTLISMAIINQPNAAILTMDSVVKRPVVVEGDAIAIRHMMYMSLSFDHRILDGMTAAQFLGSVKRRLEAYSSEIDVY